MTFNPFVVSTLPTVGNLFDSYLASLAQRNAACHGHIKNLLNHAKTHIGANRMAYEIDPSDICGWLGIIYARGSQAMADRARAYLKAVWNWGMKAKFDYRNPSSINWNIKLNPMDLIPADHKASSRVRNRFLDETEVKLFFRKLMSEPNHPASRVLTLCLLIGCRIEEACRLRVADYTPQTGVIHWEITKTGKPHSVALGQQAQQLMNEWILGNSNDRFIFPSIKKSATFISSETVFKYFKRFGFENASPRDACRRTFKTMAQCAGLDRKTIDMIQNHSDRGIASKHYDRFINTRQAIEIARNSLCIWESWLIMPCAT